MATTIKQNKAKSISQLEEYKGPIQGDELLVISKLSATAEEPERLESNKYKVKTLMLDVKSGLSTEIRDAVSADISGEFSKISTALDDKLSSVSTDLSTTLSGQFSTLSTDLSVKFDTLSTGLSSHVSSWEETAASAVIPFQKLLALSTLNHYSYIGDDINDLSSLSGHLSSISSEVIWFDTSDQEGENLTRGIKRIDNLQYEVYRLGLQLRNLENMRETGIIAGDVTNNQKYHLMEFADALDIPDDLKHVSSLTAINVYGTLRLQNKSKLYARFTPAGFDYNAMHVRENPTALRWSFHQHDDGDEHRKTLSAQVSSYFTSEVSSQLYEIDESVRDEFSANLSVHTFDVNSKLIVKDDGTALSNFVYTTDVAYAKVISAATYLKPEDAAHQDFFVTDYKYRPLSPDYTSTLCAAISAEQAYDINFNSIPSCYSFCDETGLIFKWKYTTDPAFVDVQKTIDEWSTLSAYGISCLCADFSTVSNFQKSLSSGTAYDQSYCKIYCQTSWIYTKSTEYAQVKTPTVYDKFNDRLYYSTSADVDFVEAVKKDVAYKTAIDKVINKHSWKYSDLISHAKLNDVKNVFLLNELNNYQSASSVSSVIYTVSMSADIEPQDVFVPQYTDSQAVIDAAISSLTSVKQTRLGISISTDYYDEDYRTYIKTDSPFYTDVYEGCHEEDPEDYSLSIIGYPYCDVDNFYYCKFNQTNFNLPANVDVTWSILQLSSEDGVTPTVVKRNYQEFYNYDEYGEILSASKIVLSVINRNDIVAYVDVQEYNAQKADFADKTLSLFVESNVDPRISAVAQLSVGGLPINTASLEPTVKAICPKVGTYAEFVAAKDTLYTGELVFCTDRNALATFNGTQLVFSAGGGGSITEEQIQDLALEHLTFESKADEDITHQIRIDSSGNIATLEKSDIPQSSTAKDDYKIFVSHLLQISKVYLGGSEDITERSNCLVSHNFVELTNASDADINLDDCYLFYRSYYKADGRIPTAAPWIPEKPYDGEWEFLKLNGIIKAHGTYLIRGKQCNSSTNVRMKIDKCDLEWRVKVPGDTDGFTDLATDVFKRSGDLIQFDQQYAIFHLLIGKQNAQNRVNNISPIWINGASAATNGYIDLCGFGLQTGITDVDNLCEGTKGPYVAKNYNKALTTLDNILLVRYYYMETAKQGNKKYNERVTSTFWTHVDLTFHQRHQGNYTQYYYTDEMKQNMSPGATHEKHDFFTNKTHFSKTAPNMVNIGFGIQATETQSSVEGVLSGNSDASRCFNWISFGYFDEYVMYRRVSDVDGTVQPTDGIWSAKNYSITEDTNLKEWNRYYGIQSGSSLSAIIDKLHPFYDRIQWMASDGSLVTTHKVILHGLKAGVYEYYVGRDEDPTYKSETLKFTVRNDSQVTDFSFVQTSDQQGFIWFEYQAWKNSAEIITKTEDFDFTINTGDIAQSGNRVNEYLDYYNGRQSMSDKEEMYSVGNNDLCPSDSSLLGDGEDYDKSNLINYMYYYNVEIDPRNVDDNNNLNSILTYNAYSCPIYSLYSFNYGKWHFVSLLSEVKPEYISYFTGGKKDKDNEFAKAVNTNIEKWFIKDLALSHGNLQYVNANVDAVMHDRDFSDTIIFMHEMPFTIVVTKFYHYYDTTTQTGKPSTTARTGGCHLNDYNNLGNFRFSRLFRKFKIRLVIGGHKHTFSMSKAIYDAPLMSSHLSGNTNRFIDDSFADSPEFITLSCSDTAAQCEVTTECSRQPVIEVLSGTNDSYYTENLSSISRYVVVSAITAPVYVMSQATGYKLKSNTELPSTLSGADDVYYNQEIPWLLSYFPAETYTHVSDTSTNDNRQCRPMYVKYDLNSTDKTIKVIPKQIDCVYTVKVDAKGKVTAKYDFHNLYSKNLTCVPMLFGLTDQTAYKIFSPHVNTIHESYLSSTTSGEDSYTISCTFN